MPDGDERVERPETGRSATEAAATGSEVRPDDGDRWWLTGFVDGEGCFYAGLNQHRRYGPSLVVTFLVTLRDDDAAALRRASAILGTGRLRYRQPTWSHSKPIVRLEVSNREGLAAVVAHFDAYPLRTKKAADFAVWRGLAILKQQYPPGNKASVYRANSALVEKAIATLRAGRVYGGSA